MIWKTLPATVLLFALPCAAFATSRKSHTAYALKSHGTSHSSHAGHTVGTSKTSSHGRKSSHVVVAEHHQPAAMDTERATQIQTALIHAGYMQGEPTGVWDSQSAAAMQKMQGDNGWQTKITPDSRALIKLGLGPQSSIASPATASANETLAGGQ